MMPKLTRALVAVSWNLEDKEEGAKHLAESLRILRSSPTAR